MISLGVLSEHDLKHRNSAETIGFAATGEAVSSRGTVARMKPSLEGPSSKPNVGEANAFERLREQFSLRLRNSLMPIAFRFAANEKRPFSLFRGMMLEGGEES